MAGPPGRVDEQQVLVSVVIEIKKRDTATHRSSADNARLNTQVIHQRDKIIRKAVECYFFNGAQWAGFSMTTEIHPDQAEAGGRLDQSENRFHVSSEAVLEEKSNPGSFLQVMESNVFVNEKRHFEFSDWFRSPAIDFSPPIAGFPAKFMAKVARLQLAATKVDS